MPIVHIDIPITAFSVMRREPEEFAKELRLAAAVKWYELGELSQEKAAEIAGLSRSEFIVALSRYQIDFMQYSEKELDAEIENAD